VNIPDNWVIVKVVGRGDTYYKVLAGWSGGYLDGDSWRLNSGIEKVEESEDYYDFIGYSGSVYRCRKNCEVVRMNIGGVLSQCLEREGVSLVEAKDILNEI